MGKNRWISYWQCGIIRTKEVIALARRRTRRAGKSKHGMDFDPRQANRNIKDGVFLLLFAIRENAAELYHALTGTRCSPEEIQIVTITTIVSGSLKNDLAFIVGGRVLVISEHMSSPYLNMPVRFLMYTGEIYQRWFKVNGEYKFLFGSKLCRIPTPEFVLFYNGTDPRPEKEVLRLSSAFESAVDANFGSVELKVPVYNINKGMNGDLLGRREKLRHYAEFIAIKREYMELHADYGRAVRDAVSYCIDNGILAEFLKEHGGRIVSVLATEFKLANAAKVWKTEGREEGKAEGRAETRLEIARRLISMNIAAQDVIKATGLSADQVMSLNA